MWFWVWTLLVVGTLVGAFFLARHLWRSVKGLGRELSRASQVAADMSARADELSRALEEAQPSTAPTLHAARASPRVVTTVLSIEPRSKPIVTETSMQLLAHPRLDFTGEMERVEFCGAARR